MNSSATVASHRMLEIVRLLIAQRKRVIQRLDALVSGYRAIKVRLDLTSILNLLRDSDKILCDFRIDKSLL